MKGYYGINISLRYSVAIIRQTNTKMKINNLLTGKTPELQLIPCFCGLAHFSNLYFILLYVSLEKFLFSTVLCTFVYLCSFVFPCFYWINYDDDDRPNDRPMYRSFKHNRKHWISIREWNPGTRVPENPGNPPIFKPVNPGLWVLKNPGLTGLVLGAEIRFIGSPTCKFQLPV